MLSYRQKDSKKINFYHLHSIADSLTTTLSNLEVSLLKCSAEEKYQLSVKYEAEMKELAKQLKIISTYYFQEISSKHDYLFQAIENKSPHYQAYLNAAENMSLFILYDILSSKTHIVLAAERWINVLSMSYQQNDFFTCVAIITAITRWPLSNTDIEKKISNNANKILHDLRNIIVRPKVFGEIQIEKFKQGHQFAPHLSCLAHLIEIVETPILMLEFDNNDEKCKEKTYVNEKKAEYSAIYKAIGNSIKKVEINLNQDVVIFLLNKLYDETIVDAYTNQIGKIAKLILAFNSSPSLVSQSGMFSPSSRQSRANSTISNSNNDRMNDKRDDKENDKSNGSNLNFK